MTRAIAYPSTLPGVVSLTKKRAVRAQVSEARGVARGRLLDRVYEAEIVFEIPFSLGPTFANWIDVELAQAMRKCSIPLPGAEGIVPRVCKFLGRPGREIIPGFGYRYSGTLQVCGLSRAS